MSRHCFCCVKNEAWTLEFQYRIQSSAATFTISCLITMTKFDEIRRISSNCFQYHGELICHLIHRKKGPSRDLGHPGDKMGRRRELFRPRGILIFRNNGARRKRPNSIDGIPTDSLSETAFKIAGENVNVSSSVTFQRAEIAPSPSDFP